MRGRVWTLTGVKKRFRQTLRRGTAVIPIPRRRATTGGAGNVVRWNA